MENFLKELEEIEGSNLREDLKSLKKKRAMASFIRRLLANDPLTDDLKGVFREVIKLLQGEKVPRTKFQEVVSRLKERGLRVEVAAAIFNAALERIVA